MIGKIMAVFPDNYQNIEFEKLIEVYGKGPLRLKTVLADLSDHDLSAYPISNKWSIKEIVFHITDSELIGAARIKMILGEENKDLPFYDQDNWVSNMAYNSLSEKQMMDSVKVFTAIRVHLTDTFVSLKQSDWEKTGIHAEFGNVSVRNLLELYADHSERHISQITDRRMLLGRAINIEDILPERLL